MSNMYLGRRRETKDEDGEDKEDRRAREIRADNRVLVLSSS
jgi:hypothetical protein